MIVPRYYQEEAVDAVFSFFANNPDPKRNPVIAMPTGTGKAVVIAMLCSTILQRWPTQRILMLTHVKELVEQNADKLKVMWPQAPLGIYSAGLKLKQYGRAITFAGIQSAAKNPHLFGHIDLVFVDECHLFGPDETAAYQKLLTFLRNRNPLLRVVGLSATIYRQGLGMITDNGVFTDVCYDITSLRAFNRLLDEGYISPLIPMRTDLLLDTKGVKIQGGEFQAGDLERAVNKYDVTVALLREMMEATYERRKHTLIFATGIDHIHSMHDILKSWGVKSAYVHSNTRDHPFSDTERADNLQAFREGHVQYLINKDILTTGYDFPALDCGVLARPTRSTGLHVQILGRFTRPVYAEGHDLDSMEGRVRAILEGPKPNALILDFAGNTALLGPINDPQIPKKKGEGTGEVPIKTCDHCGCMNHISARVCANCGEEFNFAVKITPKASTIDLIVRDEPVVEWFDVKRIEYSPHHKMGSPTSLKVSYFCGVRRFTEWICLEHPGAIQRKAHHWWKQRSPWDPPPSVGEAIAYITGNQEALRIPKRVKVWVNRKWPEILDYEFET